MLRVEGNGLGSILGGEDLIAVGLEGVFGDVQDGYFVIDEQDALAFALWGLVIVAGAGLGLFGLVFALDGEVNSKDAAFAGLAVDVDKAAVAADDAEGGGKAEASAFAYFLGGEEGFKDAFLYVAAHTRAFVGDFDDEVASG